MRVCVRLLVCVFVCVLISVCACVCARVRVCICLFAGACLLCSFMRLRVYVHTLKHTCKHLYSNILGGTLYHKYCAKLLQGWGGELGNALHPDFKSTVGGTEEGEQFMEDLKSISIKEVRLLISNLIEQGLDREVPNRLSEQELYVVMSATVQHMPLISQLHERTATISAHFQELSDTLSLEVQELRGEMLNLVNMLILGEETHYGRTSRKRFLDGTQ